MIGPAEYPAKLDENRPHKGTSLKNSEHLEQDTSIRFQREKKHRSGGEKIVTKELAITTLSKWKRVEECLLYPKENYCQS